MRRHLAVPIAVGVLLALTAAPVAAKPEPVLVNEELVVTEVDASGLPQDTTLYSRLVARDYPAGPVRDPSSTREVEYVDRRGSPQTEGDAVIVDIGGAGQTTVTTRAAFDKPLPVALHAEYRQGPTVLAPDAVASTDGQLRITYTVTNTTAEEKTIRYRDAQGRWTVDKQPVFAPLVGTLMITLPTGLTLLEAPGAVRSTTQDGRTQLLWNLVLFPPMGDYQQTAQVLVTGDPLAVPGLALQVLPVTSGQDPMLGFTTDLLAKSVEGNVDLADGLASLDESATALADGAGDLSRGLRELKIGTAALNRQVNELLVPGSQELARGADELADGQSEAAKGARELSKGQSEAAEGTKSAYEGAKSLEEGATALSDGLLDLYDGLQTLLEPDALPAARDSSDQLAQAVLRLRDVIGTPQDPAGSFPPSQASTLISAVKAIQQVAGISSAGADRVSDDLTDIRQALTALSADSAQAALLAASAQAQTALVRQQACIDAVVLTPAQCTALQQAISDADAARQKATDVGVGVGQQAAAVVIQKLAVEAIALALKGITAALSAIDTALEQISVALVSGNTDAPGIYEGLDALTDGLTATVDGLVKLSNGAAESAGGADQLATGTQDLTSGLDDLTEGSTDLARGAEDLADGAQQLAEGGDALAEGTQQQADGTAAAGDALGQVDSGVGSAEQGADAVSEGAGQLPEEGTSEVLASVVKASKDPAFARAYLKASEKRAADALPYGAPEGAAGRVSYLYTMPGSGESGTSSSLAGWALLAVIALAAGAVAWRRLHPVEAVTGATAAAPFEPADDEVGGPEDGPDNDAAPEDEPAEDAAPEDGPDGSTDPPSDAARGADWFFRPESDPPQ